MMKQSTLSYIWKTIFSRENPGPIENQSFVDSDGEVKVSAHEGYDYIIVNKATWDKFFEWYLLYSSFSRESNS